MEKIHKQSKKWTKHQFDNFMTEKEKNYISNIFKKKILKINKIYNYEMFFQNDFVTKEIPENREYSVEKNEALISDLKGLKTTKSNTSEKVEKEKHNTSDKVEKEKHDTFDISQDKKNIKTKKISFIKSVKLPRLMSETNVTIVDNIAVKLKIEEMIDEYLCEKYKIRESRILECFIENEKKINEYFKVPKFRKLLCDIFKDDNLELKKTIFLSLLKKSQLIIDYGNISEIFDYLVPYIPILEENKILETRFHEHFMFSLAGILLATLILINQEEMTQIFFKNLESRLEYLFDAQVKYVWRFLAVMIINLSEDEKKWLIIKLRDKIMTVVVSEDQEAIHNMSPLIEALGLELSDLM
ncbi:hypothetical protein M153_210001719 [Pseudoloma neurophilia]|uniref:mRNA decay factor PAT1 domain-containing protein n=1 Tax=Pseudoloma neurophilia TaxID=146866 RepID=A0A0R0M6K2_9MICR|nr:hypothetical protein M153_210001719 [Pseudoloma neurophilia]